MRRINVRRTHRKDGVTLPELLVVVSIIGLAVTIAIPLISEAIDSARLHTAADQLAVSLMAARMLAVTRQVPVDFKVAVAPENYFEYPDRNGKMRRYEMPTGVRIASSTDPITFRADGSVEAGARTTLEAVGAGRAADVWEIDVSILGMTTVNHRRGR
jgi:prepilin-type N-terminal cleavage/methylation domain-containing protein